MTDKADLINFDDLPLSTYLQTQGFQVVTIEPDPKSVGRARFFFATEEGIDAAVSAYFSGAARVEPRTFLKRLREVKGVASRVLEGRAND